MKPKKKKTLKIVLLVFCLIIASSFLTFGITFTVLYNKYDLDVNALTKLNNGVKVYSASMAETTLYNTDRSIIEIETLPEYVKKAFVDIEDKRFYKHNGYDLKRIIKASTINLLSKSKSQGASTISQQLVKNALLSNEKTYSRKIKEIILSMKMEKKFNKDEILEMYLNTIYFGSNAYGIENASKVYFNKSAKDLTLNEVCVLAGLIKSPYTYSPSSNYDNSVKRKNLVAKQMLDAGDISKQQYNEVVNSGIDLSNYCKFDHSYEEEAIYEACNLLNISERDLINKKYKIITFKDDNLQQQVINATANVIKDNELDSLTAILNDNGQMVAYYANSKFNLHNLKRQSASLLKPLAVYLPNIAKNTLTPLTQILDEPINYNGFAPMNADNKYHGYISTREAIKNSYNIPAVKALEYAGLNSAKEYLNKLGINIDKSDLNLSLALGSTKNGVNLLKLLNAYSVLANMGKDKGGCFINKIIDENNNVIYEYTPYNEQLLNAGDCFLINDMLKDTAKTGTARRLNSLNMPIASKTGTASVENKNTDLYNVAYSTKHTMLTWIANIKDRFLPDDFYSSTQATEINKNVLQYLYKNSIPKDFDCPDNIVKMPYDLTEYKENHKIISPAVNLDRFVGYDYFKKDNPPAANTNATKFNLLAEITNGGAKISFLAVQNKEYKLFKNISGQKELLKLYNHELGKLEFFDDDIFNYNEITYIISDGTNEEEIKIRPEDYIINRLNNEIKTSKKKWYV